MLNATAEEALGEALGAAPAGGGLARCLGAGSEPGPPGPAGPAEICTGVRAWADCSRARCQEYQMVNNGTHVAVSGDAEVLVAGDVHHYPEGTVYVKCACELREAEEGEDGNGTAAVGIPAAGAGVPCLLDFSSGADLCDFMRNKTSLVSALEPEPWMGARGRAAPAPSQDAAAVWGDGGVAVCPPRTPFAYCFGALCEMEGRSTAVCDCPLVEMPEGTEEDQELSLNDEWCPSEEAGGDPLPDPCLGIHSGLPPGFGPRGAAPPPREANGTCFDYRDGK